MKLGGTTERFVPSQYDLGFFITMDISQQLDKLQNKSHQLIDDISNIEQLEQVRISLLGKKGELTTILKEVKNLSDEQKPLIGKLANKLREEITEIIDQKKSSITNNSLNSQVDAEKIDVTMPGSVINSGSLHLIQQVIDDIEDFFVSQGYAVHYGNQIETDYYNFERMNLSKNHPARDMQDTFYITEELLLRTHTSAMQARVMEQHNFKEGPLKMISPGIVYRRDDDDRTHSHQFNQVEGLVVGKGISMADLRGTLEGLAKYLFGDERSIRLRPSFFPFTEPSIEVDVDWKIDGKQKNRWIEILGAGMVHPNVLKMSGIDPNKYSGFAFGLGPDRIAMLKYEIDDIRNFYLNDQRFLQQFSTEFKK